MPSQLQVNDYDSDVKRLTQFLANAQSPKSHMFMEVRSAIQVRATEVLGRGRAMERKIESGVENERKPRTNVRGREVELDLKDTVECYGDGIDADNHGFCSRKFRATNLCWPASLGSA